MESPQIKSGLLGYGISVPRSGVIGGKVKTRCGVQRESIEGNRTFLGSGGSLDPERRGRAEAGLQSLATFRQILTQLYRQAKAKLHNSIFGEFDIIEKQIARLLASSSGAKGLSAAVAASRPRAAVDEARLSRSVLIDLSGLKKLIEGCCEESQILLETFNDIGEVDSSIPSKSINRASPKARAQPQPNIFSPSPALFSTLRNNENQKQTIKSPPEFKRLTSPVQQSPPSSPGILSFKSRPSAPLPSSSFSTAPINSQPVSIATLKNVTVTRDKFLRFLYNVRQMKSPPSRIVFERVIFDCDPLPSLLEAFNSPSSQPLSFDFKIANVFLIPRDTSRVLLSRLAALNIKVLI